MVCRLQERLSKSRVELRLMSRLVLEKSRLVTRPGIRPHWQIGLSLLLAERVTDKSGLEKGDGDYMAYGIIMYRRQKQCAHVSLSVCV